MTTTLVDWLSQTPVDELPWWAPVLLVSVIVLPVLVGVVHTLQAHFYARMVVREAEIGKGYVRVEMKNGRVRGGSHIVEVDFRPAPDRRVPGPPPPPALPSKAQGTTDTEGRPA